MPIGYDSWGCYDTRRNRVYVGRKEHFLAYDVAANTWSAIRGKDQPESVGSCAHGAITYDTAADAVLIHLRGGEGICVYHPEDDAWTRTAAPPEVEWKYRAMNGFYSPDLNAHFYHLAGDSRDNGFMLVYRYRQAKRSMGE